MAWYHRLRNLTRRGRVDQEIDRELSFHIAERIDDLLASGMTEQEARRIARRQFGNYTLQKERTRAMEIPGWIESVGQDLRHAVRTYRRSPVWTLVAVVSLALGIGANVAVFTVLETVLFRRLPVHNPDELVSLSPRGTGISLPIYRDLRERQSVFTDMFAAGSLRDERGRLGTRITIPSESGPAAQLDNLLIGSVTANYFSVLGLRPMIGRFFTPEDDRMSGSSEAAGSVVVLSHSLWERNFARDPQILGRTILIARSPCRVIGVAPPGFFGITVGSATAAWVPVARNLAFGEYMARLKPGVSEEQAQAAMTALFQQLLVANQNQVQSIDDARILVSPGHSGMDSALRRDYGKPLWIVMGIVMLVHLIACANVANLLLARVAARRSEMAVRLAIGCGRWRLMRQLLTESMLLSVAGATAGVALAYWGSHSLVRMIAFSGPINLAQVPLQLELGVDWQVLAFLAAIGMLTGVGFGLVPALKATRDDLAPAIKGASRSDAAGTRLRLSRVVLALQVALSLLLVVGAGLLIQTIYNLHRLDKGFQTDNVVLFGLGYNAPLPSEDAALIRAARDVHQRIQQIPAVESASVSAPLLLFSRADLSLFLQVPDFGSERFRARFKAVSPGYLETLGMTLVAGRSIEERDGENAPLVAVINESMARRFFPSGAIGRIMRQSDGPPPPAEAGPPGPPIEIIGVVRDSKYRSLREDGTTPIFYAPISQRPMPLSSLEVRTREPLASIEASVRKALLEVNRDLVISPVVTLADQVAQSFAAERMIMRLCVFFGALALLLACIGLYGIMSYAVTQRTGEIGIRMALGATGSSVLRLVLGESFVVVLGGVVIGLPSAWVSTELLASFLYGVTATDPVTIVFATLLLITAAAAAALVPARRASRVDPMIALRHE